MLVRALGWCRFDRNLSVDTCSAHCHVNLSSGRVLALAGALVAAALVVTLYFPPLPAHVPATLCFQRVPDHIIYVGVSRIEGGGSAGGGRGGGEGAGRAGRAV